MRKVFLKVFEEPDKNYTLQNRNKVKDYFNNIAKRKYPEDYVRK